MVEASKTFLSRLPEQWQQNISPELPESQDICSLRLLDKLAAHPHGLDLIHAFHALYEDVKINQKSAAALVKGRSGSRVVLMDALNQAQRQLIVVSPWLSKRSIDDNLILRMTALLERGCHLYIGWGCSHDIQGVHPQGKIIHISESGRFSVNGSMDATNNYSAFPSLAKLAKRFPDQLKMKLMGTHEKYVICDDQFAFISSHNVLSSSDTPFAPREIGWKTNDMDTVQKLAQDFFAAPDLRNSAKNPDSLPLSHNG